MWDTNKWIMPQIDYGILLGKTTVINLALSPKLHHFGVTNLPDFLLLLNIALIILGKW
jgi:hypothetical protein